MARPWGELLQLAIEYECNVPKLGNVYPGAPFADMDIEAFHAAARTIRHELEKMSGEELRSVGEIVLRSVLAMMKSPGVNTSLGTILLLAPLIVAGEAFGTHHDIDERTHADQLPANHQRLKWLRTCLANVLQEMTASDSAKIYEAIAVASPGGIGQSRKMDVASTAPENLLDAMQYASTYDDVALQYVTCFELVFEYAERLSSLPVPMVSPEDCRESQWNDGIRELQLKILADRNDSLIARKGGTALANEVRARAHDLWLRWSQQRTEQLTEEWHRLDRWLRSQVSANGKQIANPGTTADLIAAAIFVRLWRDSPMETPPNR